jgi:sugar O-acyltransferase (sialic acid O-acetyltransferase NeuD family)
LKENIILIGGGGHCKSCIDVIEEQRCFEILGIVDMPNKVGETILTYPIIATDDVLEEMVKQYKNYLITIGQINSPAKRIEKYEKIIKLGGNFPVIISPRAYVSKHASVDAGTIIMHQVIVNAGARIGINCIINTGAVIEHDAVIEDNCHISTRATVNGGTLVKRGSFIGSNAVTKEQTVINENSFIKANTLVMTNDE